MNDPLSLPNVFQLYSSCWEAGNAGMRKLYVGSGSGSGTIIDRIRINGEKYLVPPKTCPSNESPPSFFICCLLQETEDEFVPVHAGFECSAKGDGKSNL